MIYKRYKELTRELINAKLDLKYMRIRRDRLIERSGPRDVGAIQYDYVGGGVGRVENVVELYKEIADCVQAIAGLEVHIKNLESLKDEYERTIDYYATTFNDLDAKIFYMKHIQGMYLRDIAYKLNYEYGTIKNRHYKMMRKIKEDYKSSDLKVTF